MNQKLRNIWRYERPRDNFRCWRVTVIRRGVRYVKCFTDSKYGDDRRALEAAIAHRDGIWAVHGGPERWQPRAARPGNASGVAGVVRYLIPSVHSERCSAYWYAIWRNEHGQANQRKFSVARYGEARARALAIAERVRQVARLKMLTGAPLAPREKEKALAVPLLHRQAQRETQAWQRTIITDANTSGVVGVGRYRIRQKVRGKVMTSHVWEAFWTDEHGKRHSRRFRIETHGESRAKASAIAERTEQMKRLEALAASGVVFAKQPRRRNRNAGVADAFESGPRRPDHRKGDGE